MILSPRVSASETKAAAMRLRSPACAKRQHACSPGRTAAQKSAKGIGGACTVGRASAVSRSILGQLVADRVRRRAGVAREREVADLREVARPDHLALEGQSQLVVGAGAGRRELVLRPRVVRVVRICVGGHAGTGRAGAAGVVVRSDKPYLETVRGARLDALTAADAPAIRIWPHRLGVVHCWRGGGGGAAPGGRPPRAPR